MPRTLQTNVVVAVLDKGQHDKLTAISKAEQVPIAEILRRAIDIAMIFDISSAINSPSKVETPTKFNFYIGTYQYEYMKDNSKEFSIDPSEWLRRIVEAYLNLKDPDHEYADLF